MKALLTLSIFFITFSSLAQDPMLQLDSPKQEDLAYQITNMYNEQLALTQKQFILFEKKVEEYLIRRTKIEEKYKGKEKLDLLFELQKSETAEMGDVLTRPQLDLYKKIKPKIQPLDKVKTQ